MLQNSHLTCKIRFYNGSLLKAISDTVFFQGTVKTGVDNDQNVSKSGNCFNGMTQIFLEL